MKEMLNEIRFRDDAGNILRLSDITKEEYEDKFLTSQCVKHGEPIEEQGEPLPAASEKDIWKNLQVL